MSDELPIEVEIIRPGERKTTTKTTLFGTVTASDSTKQSLSTPSIRSRSGIIHLPHSTELPIPASPKIGEGTSRRGGLQESEARTFSEASPDSPLCEPQFSRPAKEKAEAGKEKRTTKHKTHFNNDENQNANEDGGIEVDDQKLFQTEKVSPLHATNGGGVSGGGGEKNRSTDFEISNTSYSFALSPFFGRLAGGAKEGGEGDGSRCRKGGGGSIAGDEEMFSGDVISEVSAAVHASGSIHRGYNDDTGDYSDMDVSAPKRIRARSRARKRRHHTNNQSSSAQREGNNGATEGRSGTRQRSNKANTSNTTTSSASLFRSCWKVVWRKVRTPSVASLTALMVILCVAVSFATMLAVVGALMWSSSTGDQRQEALLAALHTTRMRAAASEGFKLLQQGISTLDNVQLLTLRRDTTQQMLNVSGRALVEGLEEQAMSDYGDVPAKTYAPTSDASALLELGPLIDELTTASISFVHQSGPESTRQIGELARQAGYVLQNDGNGSVSSLGWARVPRFVVGLEDGRYAKTGPYPRTGVWEHFSAANYTQYVLVVDGDHRNQTFSGDFDNSFPRLNMPLSSEDLESIPPKRLLNDTLWPSGGVRPRLYSNGVWSLEMDDAGLEGDPTPLIAIDGFSPPVWISWPGIFDAANLSTGIVSRLRRSSPLGYIGSTLEYARKSNWYNTSRSSAPRQKILHGLSIDTDSNIGNSPCLTLTAPLYFRRKPLTTQPGNATKPLGGSQKSRVTYSSSGDREVDNFINANYVFVGVSSALIPIDGLSSHLGSVIIGLTGAISDIDKNNPPFQLFLLRGDFVWASSLSHLSTIVTLPDPIASNPPPQDEKGRSECARSAASGREEETRWCLHTIQSFGHQLLSSAKKALPAIVAPPSLLPYSMPPAGVADRAKDFMRSSSSFRVLFPATLPSSDASTSFLADGSSYEWHATYSLMDTGAFAKSDSSASTTTSPPFVLLLLSREDQAASKASSASANNDEGNKNNNISHFTIIVIVSAAILIIIAAIAVVVSRIVLRPLRTVAEIMSLSLHLVDESASSCDSRTAALIEKFREKMKDRTLSRWEEVRAIQKGYWMMSEEIQKLKAYIPEHLREEVVAMRSKNRRRSLRALGTSSSFSQKTDTLESGMLGMEQSNAETPETMLSPNECISPTPQVSPAPPTSIFEDVNQNREPNIEKGTAEAEVAVATASETTLITMRRASHNAEDHQSAQMHCEFAADGSRLVVEDKQREGNTVTTAVVGGGESCATIVNELAAPSPEAKVANVLQGPPPPQSQLSSSPPLPSSRPPLPLTLTKVTLMGAAAAAASAAPESLHVSTTAPPKLKGGLAGGEVNVGGKSIGMHSIVSLGVVLDSLHGGDGYEEELEEEEEASRGGGFGSSTSTGFASGRRRRKGGAKSATDGGADDTDASQFTSNGSSVASPKSNYQRPVFFADSALVDRDITVVHINIVHFHYYARSTHSPSISRDYEEFISFVHLEARRFGGMLESFSGDKVWVSFNASSKCVNGPVAAAYYAYSVTSTVNNAVIRKGATGAKAFSHPIFTNRTPEKYFRIAPYGVTCGVATGRAFVGPLGNSSVKRHTIISNAVSEAAALERQALRYPGCNVLIGGDMIPAIEGYCQYLLVDATLLPGTEGRRRRIACLKGPMLAVGKDPDVVKRWILPPDNNNNKKESAAPIAHNPYRTVNEAMNAFLEGQNEVCKRLVRQAGLELIAPPTALCKLETDQSGEGEDAAKNQLGSDDPLVAIRASETLWEAKERAAFVTIIIKFLQVLLTMGVEGRSYRSQIGESHVPIPHALCCYTLGS